MKNTKNKALTIVLIIASVLFILSSSMLLPIASRSFYFSWVEPLGILDDLNVYAPAHLGREATIQDIYDAYNSVMDFIWKGASFAKNPDDSTGFLTGALPLTAAGRDHFKDCIFLFWLDLDIFLISGLSLIGILLLRITKKYEPIRIWKRSPLFFVGILTIGIIAIIALIVIVTPSFRDAYVFFHKILFPGKDNYYFNEDKDMFVLLLPERYIIVCAITISILITLQSSGCILFGIFDKKIKKKKEALEVK